MQDVISTPIPSAAAIHFERLPRLTVQAALRLKDTSNHLYVLNTADAVTAGKGGVVYITIVQKDGETQSVPVERTWLPQDLASYLPREVLLNSSKFMYAVNRGLVTIITDEAAEVLLQDSNARAEQARIMQNNQVVQSSQAARTIGQNVTYAVGDSSAVRAPNPTLNGGARQHGTVQHTQQASGAPTLANAPKRTPLFASAPVDADPVQVQESINLNDHFASLGAPAVSADFVAFVDQINGIEDGQARNQLRMKYSQVSRDELQYLTENVVHASIKNWAGIILAQL